MNKTLLTCALLTASLTAGAQNGANIGMGGSEGDYASLAEKVAKIEKKNDAFNVYFNYAASFQAERNSLADEWHTGFANKQLRLEIKGNIGDHLFYRLRHRLNKTNEARTQDNFSKATDIMMAGWKFNDKWSVQAGKMCQIWGGFEFVEVSDANNDSFSKVYGAGAASQEENSVRPLTSSRNPLTYIANWNGSFADGMINTRWSWGIQTQARHKYSRMLILGQQLNLDKFQWYVDYMGAWDGLDRLGIATSDLGLNGGGQNLYASDVHYNSFITKVNWQFAPHWNLMLKGMYETASVSKLERGKNYRKSFGYMSSVEYYPLKDQDFRVFLAYVGRKYDFSEKSGLKDYNTNRIELGFMYRIKAFQAPALSPSKSLPRPLQKEGKPNKRRLFGGNKTKE